MHNIHHFVIRGKQVIVTYDANGKIVWSSDWLDLPKLVRQGKILSPDSGLFYMPLTP